MTDRLRPWVKDFHVAQNDATVKGSGSHDKTGRHCLPNDPNGKMDIVRAAGLWMRDEEWVTNESISAHQLGRLYVSQRNDAQPANLAEHSLNYDCGAERARMELKESTECWG